MAYSELSGSPTFETQLRFVNSVNVILMIRSAELLRAVKDLVDNYNDEKGTVEKQQAILNRIVFRMRCDVTAADAKQLAKLKFPIIIPDIKPGAESKRERAERLPYQTRLARYAPVHGGFNFSTEMTLLM